ncbi:MAG TPA: glycosyltransferase family 4 protein [Actinomycetota bacterium]|nr:glycosyltransferase family 4 protein [Actinomycetota bacterium]
MLWHGYLLAGSGSNIYTANVARAWRARGHHVTLLCQDRAAGARGWVDADGDFAPDNSSWRATDTGAPSAPGRCTVLRPAIGGLLPVYVYDRYEGFEVKRFVELSEDELGRYVEANVDALATAIERLRPHAIVVGHEVMGPYVARVAADRTGSPYVAKLHGSALEYAVRVQDRYLEYARLGLCGAKAVTGGSRYMIEAASEVIPGWRDKAVVVNPGCDVELFRPARRRERRVPRVGYVGKLIAAKGLHNLLAATGLTSFPLSLEVVGYGGFEEGLRMLAGALRRGDRAAAASIARAGEGAPLEHLAAFLGSARADEAYLRRASAAVVTFHGRLEHGPLARVLPGFDALVVPSVVPEAFGMVAAEAAACGVLPIVPRHSGIGEVGAAIEGALRVDGLLTYDPARPIEGIAQALDRVLALPFARRRALGRAASELARARWSWERVAQRLLDVALHGAARAS